MVGLFAPASVLIFQLFLLEEFSSSPRLPLFQVFDACSLKAFGFGERLPLAECCLFYSSYSVLGLALILVILITE